MTSTNSASRSTRRRLDGPYGMAWLRCDAPRDILYLAGGSWLAPMVSIARAAMVEPRLAARAASCGNRAIAFTAFRLPF